MSAAASPTLGVAPSAATLDVAAARPFSAVTAVSFDVTRKTNLGTILCGHAVRALNLCPLQQCSSARLAIVRMLSGENRPHTRPTR